MKFKCKTTNLVYNFEHAVDVVSMEKHPDYESVPDNEAVPESEPVVAPKATKKTVKQDETSIDG
jgi:hypothetical protein